MFSLVPVLAASRNAAKKSAEDSWTLSLMRIMKSWSSWCIWKDGNQMLISLVENEEGAENAQKSSAICDFIDFMARSLQSMNAKNQSLLSRLTMCALLSVGDAFYVIPQDEAFLNSLVNCIKAINLNFSKWPASTGFYESMLPIINRLSQVICKVYGAHSEGIIEPLVAVIYSLVCTILDANQQHDTTAVSAETAESTEEEMVSLCKLFVQSKNNLLLNEICQHINGISGMEDDSDSSQGKSSGGRASTILTMHCMSSDARLARILQDVVNAGSMTSSDFPFSSSCMIDALPTNKLISTS